MTSLRIIHIYFHTPLHTHAKLTKTVSVHPCKHNYIFTKKPHKKLYSVNIYYIFYSKMLTIENNKICDFYEKNPQFNIESINLLFIDVLEKNNGGVEFNYEMCREKMQIRELGDALSKLKTYNFEYNKWFVDKLISIKTSYFCELKSHFTEEIEEKTRLSNIKSSNSKMISSIEKHMGHLKTANYCNSILREFKKLMDGNVEYLANATQEILLDFFNNYEQNIISLCVSFEQIWRELIEQKEKDVVSFSAVGEDSFSRILFQINEMIQYFSFWMIERKSEFEDLLLKNYSVGEISRETDNTYILYRQNKPNIYIECRGGGDADASIQTRNLTIEETRNFLQKTSKLNINGILISQWTDINGKSDFQIEIVNSRVLVYIHKMENNEDKIKMAVEIIDSIQAKIGEFQMVNNGSGGENRMFIPKEILDDINREYQSFILQKETLLSFVRESNKKMLGQIEDIKFLSLDKYLSTRYISSKKQGYTCDLCHNFNVPTLKGLAAHKRGCCRKLGIVSHPAGARSNKNSSSSVNKCIQENAEEMISLKKIDSTINANVSFCESDICF